MNVQYRVAGQISFYKGITFSTRSTRASGPLLLILLTRAGMNLSCRQRLHLLFMVASVIVLKVFKKSRRNAYEITKAGHCRHAQRRRENHRDAGAPGGLESAGPPGAALQGGTGLH